MLEQIWQFLVEKLSGLVPYISPFWTDWLPLGVGIAVGAILMAWLFPPLRSLSGAVVMSVVAFLYAFRKGEEASDAKNKKEIERLKRQSLRYQSKQPWWGGW